MPITPSSLFGSAARFFSPKPVDAGPAALAPAQAAQAQAAIEYKMAALATSAPWWPRGLGLQVDDGALRHQFEPPEGARSWLQMEKAGSAWTAPGSVARHAVRGGADLSSGVAFLGQLLYELKGHLRGLEPKALSRLPRDANEMLSTLANERPEVDSAARARTIERGRPAQFRPGETLSPPVAIAVGASVEAVKADVAQRLGAVLLERFGWDHPTAIRPEPFERLTNALAQDGGRHTAWSLRVAPDRGVTLKLHAGRTETELGAVLPPGPHLSGAAIYRPHMKDNLEGDWKRAAELYNGGQRPVGPFMLPMDMPVDDPRRPLAGIDPQGRILVEGHGGVVPLPGRLPLVLDVGGHGPRSMARALIRQGLPKEFKGTVQLDACYSAQGLGTQTSFAHRLQSALAAKGWKQVTVAGRPGVTRGLHNQAQTVPSELRGRSGGEAEVGLESSDKAPRASAPRRLLDRLKRFFGAATPDHRDADDVDLDRVGIRGMWGRVGPKPPSARKPPASR